MLDIDIDSRYGILFVRLFGKLNKYTMFKLKDEVMFLIENAGINNIVINIQNLYDMDKEGINMLKRCYKSCTKSLICINYSQVNMIENMKFTFDEMSAYNLIKI
ncbi:MAG: hypothetical protein IKF01_03180 [Bacilli bacterium]|nr:hypothetical protein [Bacilli bacterium]